MQHAAPLTSLPPLVALRAISNGALKGDALPSRIKLLNWGENDSTQGKVIVDDVTVAALAANQRALGYDRVALDFSHNTVPGSPEFERTKEPRDVAGYGTPEVVKGDGLYLADVTWTASGQSSAKNYADLSPTPALDSNRRVTFLHSAALVRNGSVFDLSFFSAAPGAACSETNDTQTTDDMTPEQIQSAIAAALKPVTDTISTLTAEVKALKEAKPAVITFETKVGDKTVTLDAGGLAEKVISLEATLAAQKAATEEAEKCGLLSRFGAEGKVPLAEDGKPVATEALKTFSAPELRRLLANTPATVPLSARGRVANPNAANDSLKGLDRAIAAHKQERATVIG